MYQLYRLHRLADFLETIDPEAFDIHEWKVEEDGPTCGFAACAVGWAAEIPEFKRAGLRSTRISVNNPKYGIDFVTRSHSYGAWGAVEHFFGLNEAQAAYLFEGRMYDHRDVLPHEVADRIREFLAKK